MHDDLVTKCSQGRWTFVGDWGEDTTYIAMELELAHHDGDQPDDWWYRCRYASGVLILMGELLTMMTGITNGSDFSRYAKGPRQYLVGTTVSAWIVGTLVSLVGLVVTSACQKLYGSIYWNPPDLLLRVMDNGQGSSKSRAGVFFLALGFMSATLFENVCGNAVAGGIDLAGLFPKYIDIRRGAMITFIAVWICQPW